MAEFEVFIRVLVALAAGIVALGGAFTFFEHLADRATTKRNKVVEQVQQHTETLEKHTQYLDADNKRLKEMEESNRLIMRGMMGIMTHEIDGNHTEQLKQARDEMQDYLINR